jgi:cell division protease FtsH
MRERIIVLLGGRCSEEIFLDDICTGASNDIERATATARNMVTKYGFSSKIGTVAYTSDNDEVFLGKDYGHTKNYSEAVAAQIDEEVRSIIETAYKECIDLLTANADKVHALSKYLLKFEKIDGDDFEKLMRGELNVDLSDENTVDTTATVSDNDVQDTEATI